MRRLAVAAVALSAGACASDSPAPAASPPPIVATATAPIPPAGTSTFEIAGPLTQGGWVRGTAPAGTTSLSLDGAVVPVAPDRRFFVAFDRDAGPSAVLVARLRDGRSERRELAIAPRAWQIERVDTPLHPPIPDADYQRIRAGELALIGAARSKETGAQGWRQSFVWPVRARISGRFGSQRIYRGGVAGSYHSGLDIAGGGGTAFVAPADGVVILAASSPFTLEGNLLMIDHGAGLNSAFLHCSELLVREGESVRQGQVIGRIGMTGRATGPHLHWSLKWRETRLDPLLFVPARD